ncbi:hypothetical protein CPB83DRAFT_928297, partial [Crepidotus variabilis]
MALIGDRFSRILAAKAPSGKTLYYPLAAPQNEVYNPGRPACYDTKDLPMRTQESYWETIAELEKATTKKDQSDITRRTGVSRLPLCAASPAFLHPTFFPIDPFHLFYENCTAFLWDTMTAPKDSQDQIHFSKSAQMGALIPLAMETLPPSFCGPVRDVHLKRNSQFKIYEWMAVLHWYFIPIAIELALNSIVLSTFAQFVEIIDFAMTIKPRSEKDLEYLHDLITQFLTNYERLFVANDPAKLHHARLCIFQLIHVPIHIQWNGSIRLGSQATVERAIGEAAHKIRSKKAPFSNLESIIYRRELFKILILYYPDLLPASFKSSPKNSSKPMQAHRIAWTKLAADSTLSTDLDLLSLYIGLDIRQKSTKTTVLRWGKFRLPNGNVLQSSLSKEGMANGNLIFGHAWAFYTISTDSTSPPRTLAIYTPLISVTTTSRIPRGKWAVGQLAVVEVAKIRSLVGIWTGVNTKGVYILRKHPGLDYLATDERGVEAGDLVEDEDQDEN